VCRPTASESPDGRPHPPIGTFELRCHIKRLSVILPDVHAPTRLMLRGRRGRPSDRPAPSSGPARCCRHERSPSSTRSISTNRSSRSPSPSSADDGRPGSGTTSACYPRPSGRRWRWGSAGGHGSRSAATIPPPASPVRIRSTGCLLSGSTSGGWSIRCRGPAVTMASSSTSAPDRMEGGAHENRTGGGYPEATQGACGMSGAAEVATTPARSRLSQPRARASVFTRDPAGRGEAPARGHRRRGRKASAR
jgi:hypothetical protein